MNAQSRFTYSPLLSSSRHRRRQDSAGFCTLLSDVSYLDYRQLEYGNFKNFSEVWTGLKILFLITTISCCLMYNSGKLSYPGNSPGQFIIHDYLRISRESLPKAASVLLCSFTLWSCQKFRRHTPCEIWCQHVKTCNENSGFTCWDNKILLTKDIFIFSSQNDWKLECI